MKPRPFHLANKKHAFLRVLVMQLGWTTGLDRHSAEQRSASRYPSNYPATRQHGPGCLTFLGPRTELHCLGLKGILLALSRAPEYLKPYSFAMWKAYTEPHRLFFAKTEQSCAKLHSFSQRDGCCAGWFCVSTRARVIRQDEP